MIAISRRLSRRCHLTYLIARRVMSFGFIQQLMLLGLAGVALPVIAHLLSKRKFDIVHWGAMQFLELGRRTRRRIRLEELLLLLLRIGVISVLALAFARPWGKGGLFSMMSEAVRRDVVYVVDGSYSMGWTGGQATPHAKAKQLVHQAVGALHSGDTVSLLDAREQVLPVIAEPTTDLRVVREEVDKLSPPAGSSRLAAAATRAVQMLGKTTNPVHEVVILTDGQAFPWAADDAALWARFDDLCSQQAIRPRIWVLDVVGQEQGTRNNFSIDRIQLSRSTTVPDFPVRIRTIVRQSAGATARRSVYLSINGQRLNDRTTVVSLPAQGEAPVEFEHRFPSEGSFLVTVSIDEDELPGDNAAHAAVVVSSGVPVLLVDGDKRLDPVKAKSFFVKAALTSAGNTAPWVRSTVVEPSGLTAKALEGIDVVMLLDVDELSDGALKSLSQFVERGGGLIIAPGEHAKAAFYNGPLFAAGKGLSPAELGETAAETPNATVVLDGDSLEVPWMARFKPGSGVDLAATRFSRWWTLKPAAIAEVEVADAGPAQPTDAVRADAPVIAARLKNGTPWLVTRRFGEGQVALAATSFDNQWSTLPSKNDFVPLLHEMIFSMVSRNSGRNVEVGMPLEFPLPPNVPVQGLQFVSPDDKTHSAQRGGDDARPTARLDAAYVPGVYRAVRKNRPESPEYFVVEFDRREADLEPLADSARKALGGDNRVRFIDSVEDLAAAAAADSPRSELWWILLVAVLALLVFEVAMTRRLVRGGHELVDQEDEAAAVGSTAA
jgi:hypothetical protein